MAKQIYDRLSMAKSTLYKYARLWQKILSVAFRSIDCHTPTSRTRVLSGKFRLAHDFELFPLSILEMNYGPKTPIGNLKNGYRSHLHSTISSSLLGDSRSTDWMNVRAGILQCPLIRIKALVLWFNSATGLVDIQLFQ